MTNWEFFDNQTPESAIDLVDDLRAGKDVAPTRGADKVCTFKRGRAGARRLPRRPRRRGRERRPGVARWAWASPGARLASPPATTPARRTADAADAPATAPPVEAKVEAAPSTSIDAPSEADARLSSAGRTDPGDRHADPDPDQVLGRHRSWTWPPTSDHEGYAALRKALAMTPEEIIAIVKDSSLRGRGGAGFPTGIKWSFMPQADGEPHYLVVNADESEPGTCKDIPLMMADPHVLIEGVVIASYAIGCEQAFIYLRGETVHVYRRLLRAVEEAYARRATSARTSSAAAATSTSSSTPAPAPTSAARRRRCSTRSRAAAASRGSSRRSPRPPVSTPARPSVNNVESIAVVPGIVRSGADWFSEHGDGEVDRLRRSSACPAT